MTSLHPLPATRGTGDRYLNRAASLRSLDADAGFRFSDEPAGYLDQLDAGFQEGTDAGGERLPPGEVVAMPEDALAGR